MKVLDLFSGIGGFSLGLERAGMETVAFCEYDKKARLVLKKHWPDVPIYDDVRELTYDRLLADSNRFPSQVRGNDYADEKKSSSWRNNKRGSRKNDKRELRTQKNEAHGSSHALPSIDLICGGFPCQPFSQAGKRQGSNDDRHLWPEYFRLIQELKPRWVIGENVAGLISMGLDEVLSDLESADYTWETFIIPACAVNAPHRRDRVWIVAHSESDRVLRGQPKVCQKERGPGSALSRNIKQPGEDVPHSNGTRPQGRIGKELPECPEQRTVGEGDTQAYLGDHWESESGICRVANGVSGRVDRLKQLGNAVVPQVIEIIGRAIMEANFNQEVA